MSEKKILYISRPDEQTLAFWKATADDQNEYVARIAKFSRALGKNGTFRSWVRPAVRRENGRSLGRLLFMPSRAAPRVQSTGQFVNTKTQDAGEGNVAAPGVRAKKLGKKLKRGRALQVMVYPRRKTKGVLVEASRDVERPLSSFILLASLKEAAALRGCDIADLIPPDELQQYSASRISRKRSAAAKRVSVKAKGT